MSSASEVVCLFQKAGIKTTLSKQIMIEVWKKFIFISALSTVTCLARAPIGPILANQHSRKVLEKAIDEIISVARVLEPNLYETVGEETVKQLESLPEYMTASMERDLERGKPLEVENLQGYLVRKASNLRIEVPALGVCYGLLKIREYGKLDRT